jgi:hypothetical protein
VKTDAFAQLMTEKLDDGGTNARNFYIRSVIEAIEVGDKTIRIIGSNDVLQAVISRKQSANGNVRGFGYDSTAIQFLSAMTLKQSGLGFQMSAI